MINLGRCFSKVIHESRGVCKGYGNGQLERSEIFVEVAWF